MASRPIFNTKTATGKATRMVPKLPISWRTRAGPVSITFWICGPTVVPNFAMNGMIAMAIMVPATFVALPERTRRVPFRMFGFRMMPIAKA
jgi:hypothetical protein